MATIDPKTMERTVTGTRALDLILQARVIHHVHAYEPSDLVRLCSALMARLTTDVGPG